MEFGRITPKEAGIPTEAIVNFVNQLKENEVNLHGFLMIKGGNILAEGFCPPFQRDYIHRMYSITKSFVSLAIGCLIEEGKLRLDDHICDYFPDKLEGETHPYIQEIKIKDMLRMATAHQMTTYKRYDGDWVKSFFVVEPNHMPGTVFSYDTSSSHVLAALVERLSGKSLLDYLRDKFLDDLGFSEDALILKDPYGVSMGGSGLMCSIMDVAKVAYLCLKEGKLNGKQYVPADYIREATKFQITTEMNQVYDEQLGYGYQFWKNRDGGFTLYGMGGQLAVCFPKHDFIYITIADTQGSQISQHMLYEAFYQNVFPYVTGKKKMIDSDSKSDAECAQEACNVKAADNIRTSDNKAESLKQILKNLQTPAVQGTAITETATRIQGKEYRMDENTMGITSLSLRFTSTQGVIDFSNGHGTYQIPFGVGYYEHVKNIENDYDLMLSGAFVQENELHLRAFLLGKTLGNVRAVLSFKENYVSISAKKAGEDILNEFQGIACGHYNK